MGLVKKPTGFMTSSKCIARALNARCTGGHDHVPLVGGRAAGAAIDSKMFCKTIVTGGSKQKAMDSSSLVDTVKMDKGQLSSCWGEWYQSTGWEMAHRWGGRSA